VPAASCAAALFIPIAKRPEKSQIKVIKNVPEDRHAADVLFSGVDAVTWLICFLTLNLSYTLLRALWLDTREFTAEFCIILCVFAALQLGNSASFNRHLNSLPL
jgi:hypothetical protein